MRKRSKQIFMTVLAMCVLICIVFNCGTADVMCYLTTGLTVNAVKLTDYVIETYRDYNYVILDDGTAEIIRYIGSEESVNIPSSINGKPVTSIGLGAFYGNTGLTSVIIPGKVKNIKDSAFFGCTSLISVTIPDSVTNIGWSVFSGCTSLSSITIPDSVTSIGQEAFFGCTSLTSVTIPNSVTNIGAIAFRETPFYNNQTNDFIMAGHVLIGYQGKADKVIIPDRVTSIGGSTFFGCTNLTSVTIPESVTSIGDGAFYGCTSLTSITIPESVTSIGDRAFLSSNRLNEVIYFGTKDSFKKIEMTDETRNQLNPLVKYETKALTSTPISDPATSQPKENLNIVSSGNCGANGDNVRYTLDKEGTLVVSGNGAMQKFGLDDTDTPIFYSLKDKIKKVVFKQGVTTIEGNAFSGCDLIELVEVSASIQTMYSSGLGDSINIFRCKSLQRIDVDDNNENFCSIDGVLFSKKAGKYENVYMFDSKEVRKEYEINEKGCLIEYPMGRKDEKYIVPENVQIISSNAFSGNQYLNEIILPEDIKFLGKESFSSTQFIHFIIPNNTETINNGAFAACTKLKDIYIPRELNTVCWSAFSMCDSLTDVYYEGTEEEWNRILDNGSNDPLFNAKKHFGVKKMDYVDAYRVFTFPKIIEPGMTFQIGAAKLGGDFTGISLPENEKAEWVVSNPERIQIIASKDNHTQAVMQALSIGDCDVMLKINGVAVCTETLHISLSYDTLANRYKDCIMNAPTLTSIKNGLRTSTDILSELSWWDIQTATAFTMLSQDYLGIDMAIDYAAKYFKTGQYFSDSDDSVLNQIITTYLSLPQDDNYIAEFTKKYQLVYNTVQAGKSLKGVKDNFFQQLSNATSFDSKSIKELFSSAGDLDVFDKLGYVADTYISYQEISATVLLIAQFNLDTIRHLKAVVSNADNGSNTSLFKALERLEKKIKNLDMYSNTEYLKATLKSILKITADALLDELLPGSTLVIDLANFVASIYENDGGIMLDDVNDLTVSLHFANIIYLALINSTNGQELQDSFDLLKAATLVSLQCDVPIIEGKSKLKNYKKKVKKISDEIIKNCSFSKLLLEATESAQDKKATLTNNDMIEQIGIISQYGITTSVDQETTKSTSSGVSGTPSTSSSSDYLSIPSNKNGYYITGIAKEGYKGYTGNTIAIPDSIQVIGQEAFSDCKNLQTILLGSKLQKIGKKAFSNCISLEYISIPKSVQTIENKAFENCSKLDVISINAKNVGDEAFSGCKNLSRVCITDQQATIGKNAFSNCHKDLTIVGYSGSTSEIYAKANSISFEPIKEYISNISISKTPTKKNYMLGEEVDTTGMELTVEYKDGTKKTVNSGWIIAYDTASYGNKDTYVIYGDSQVSYQIVVDSEPDIDLSFDSSKIEMLFGTEYSIAERLNISSPYDSLVTWSSDSPEIVSVDCFGLLRSLTPGKATISAKTPYSNKIAECEVVVTDSIMIEPDSSPKFIMFEPVNNNQYVFSANPTTGNTSLYVLDDQNQVINGTNDLKTSLDCYLQSKSYVLKISTEEAIELSISGYSTPKYLSLVNENGQNVTKVTGYPGDDISLSVNSDENDATYYWDSSNLSVADVDKGNIHLNDSGIATITVRNSRNEIAKCKVVVLEKKPELSIISDISNVSSSENSDDASISNDEESNDSITSSQDQSSSISNESPQSQSNPIVYILLFVFLAVVIIVIAAIVVIRKKQKHRNTTI